MKNIDHRNVMVGVRLTRAEYDLLNKARGKMSRSLFMRNTFINGKPPMPIALEQWASLSRVMSNLNQMARLLNSNDKKLTYKPLVDSIKETKAALIEVRDILKSSENDR